MKRIAFFFCSIVFPVFLFSHSLTGKVVNYADQPIVGAYLLLLQSDLHTHTDEFGKFTFQDAPLGDSLQVLHLGYETYHMIVEEVEEEIIIKLTEAIFELGEIVVGQNAKTVNIISRIDIELAPVNSSQDVLRKVPGLFIGQHAGGGKAEQIFLRGFDIDHGTDVNLTVDGMPVNMVSHAHGQGYADLPVVIPETIKEIDFGKGPYYADKGNFATAGYVEFATKDELEESQIGLEFGSFNSFRTVGLLKLLDKENQNAYIAAEYMLTDGPFESSQEFLRNNIMGKYHAKLGDFGHISFVASHFTSKWDASGQIPERLVDRGTITRFGAVDDTEGGKTGRTNLALDLNQVVDDNTFLKHRLFYSFYDFELYSNFTFFLNDPVNADQIRQKEKRQIFGFESSWNRSSYVKNVSLLTQLGIGLRSDDIDGNELSRTRNRKTTLSNIQLGDVDEKNLYAFARTEIDMGSLLIEPSVRFDYFKFNYLNSLDSLYNNQTLSKGIVSPKLNMIYNLDNSVQLFLKTGVGFHSNDARVVLEQDNKSILPAAYGADLGTIFKPAKRVFTTIALWYLFLEQEFVYVGDEGVVEPSGKSRRLGVDFGLRYQISDFLFFSGDFNYAFARSVEEPETANRIPLAPVLTSTASLSYSKNNFSTGLQMRYLGDRAANEDNSIVAKGYLIADYNISYDIKNINFGIAIENLFNQEWNETQFATESRLFDEPVSVEEIHFTPGTPFAIKGIMKYKF